MISYKELEVWKAAVALVKDVYTLTKDFPKEEQYGLTSQVRRAAVSIAANIAESNGRQYKKDSLQLLHIARGSLYELDTLITISRTVDILDEDSQKRLEQQITACLKLLNGFIRYMENSELK
jgi:four helix bundle protein